MSGRLPPGNLPAEVSSFVGRRGEMVEARRVLSAARLVTLTGLAGVGKSRLSIRLAADARRGFPDGVWLVELAGLGDGPLVARAVVDAVGIVDQTPRPAVRVLIEALAGRRSLLLLDNCEHLVDAVAELVATLLSAAPGLRVLATSREPLRVAGEHVYAVAPLSVPGPDEPLGLEAASRYPGLELFRQRAAAARPGFAITVDNIDAVVRVCRRLDGLPLAIELAAARLDALSAQELASRLDDRFALLTTGGPVVARHQTLRAAVGWSFELCDKPQRALWMAGSVFAGGFDLAAVEAVCAGDDLLAGDVFEAVAGLVGKSVLVAEEHAGRTRYRMLDTVREFGLDRLRHPAPDDPAVGDEAMLRSRHRDFYLELAERFDADWFGPRQPEWTQRMRAERDNLRAAFGHCLDRGDANAALALAGAMYYFWYACGAIPEGVHWLRRALDNADDTPSRVRAWALFAYARLLQTTGRNAAALPWERQSVQLARQLGDPQLMALGLSHVGNTLLYTGAAAEAPRWLGEAEEVARGLDPTDPTLAAVVVFLAFAELIVGNLARTAELCAQAVTICRAHGERWWQGYALVISANAALALGDAAQALDLAQQSLRLRRVLGDTLGLTSSLERLAWIAATTRDYPLAARLMGAADRHWQLLGTRVYGVAELVRQHNQHEQAARRALGDTAFDEQFRRGSLLSLDDAVALALGEGDQARGRDKPTQAEPAVLTRRQRQVAELIAKGATNKQIAERLIISQRTAESHVEQILIKLGFTSRSQIAIWVVRDHSRSAAR